MEESENHEEKENATLTKNLGGRGKKENEEEKEEGDEKKENENEEEDAENRRNPLLNHVVWIKGSTPTLEKTKTKKVTKLQEHPVFSPVRRRCCGCCCCCCCCCRRC